LEAPHYITLNFMLGQYLFVLKLLFPDTNSSYWNWFL